MDLVDEYLRAVAALLPKAQREDIAAELRDTILTRIEAREAELGRALTGEETESVLREIGHPVVVAARYRGGPQYVVGPALYPYWAFALKLGLAIQVAAALIVLVVQIVAFGEFGQALSRAISSVVSGGLAIVGVATAVAWFVERRGFRIDYLDNWHVRDVRFLEYVAWDWDTLRDGLAGRGWPGQTRWRPPPPPPGSPPPPTSTPPSSRSSSGPRPRAAARPAAKIYAPPPPPSSASFSAAPPHWRPVGEGVALLVAGAVLTLWWIGLARYDLNASPGVLRSAGFDPGDLAAVDWDALRATLFWPILAFGVAVICRGVVLAAHPWAVRLHGLLEAMTGGAVAAFGGWLWTSSPLSPAIRVDGFTELAFRLSGSPAHVLPLAPLATVAVALLTISGLCGLFRGLWDLMAGPPPFGPWPVGI
jgi:hypothetical protein